MVHILKIDEMKVNEVYTSPAESKLFDYYADGVNGLHKNTSDSSWVLMGNTWDDVLNYLENEGYTHVYDFSDGDTEIYENDGVYYMMNIEQEEEGSWGSWIVDLTPVMNYVNQLL